MSFSSGSKPVPLARRFVIAVSSVVVLAVMAYAFAYPPTLTAGSLDFNAFFCAGRILTAGGDPYRYGPMHNCEIQNMHPGTPNAVVPAPLPPYGIEAFAPLAKLPFAQAGFIWFLVLIGSAMLIVWAVVELTGLPLLLVAVCVVVSVLLQTLLNGALAPLPIGLMCAAAVAVVRARWTLAALLLGLACIEPHVALPPMLATFVLVPQMRARLGIVAAVVAIVTLAAGGAGLNIEYFTAVLPAHVASELGTSGQYSLSAMLHTLGIADGPAVATGSAQYALFALAGVWLGWLLRRRIPGSIVLAPMALAVTGGTFIHLTQISAALPFALLVAANARSNVAWLGVTLVAVPWQFVLENETPIFAGFVVFAVLLWGTRVSWIKAVFAGVASSAALWFICAKFSVPAIAITAIPRVPDGALAEVAWKALAGQFPPAVFWWPGHTLTYLGLLCAYWSAIAYARRGPNLEAGLVFDSDGGYADGQSRHKN